MERVCEHQTKTEITGCKFCVEMEQQLVGQWDVYLEDVGQTCKDARCAPQDQDAAHEISGDAHTTPIIGDGLQSMVWDSL